MSKQSRLSQKSTANLLDDAVNLHKAGTFDAAAAAYETVLKRTPDAPQVLYLLGAAYAQGAHFKEAIPKLERSLKRRPGFLPAIELIGSTWIQLKAPDKALAYL